MSAAFYLWPSKHAKNEEEVVDIDKTMPPSSEANHSWKPEVAVKPSKGKKAGKLSGSQQQGTKKQPQRGPGVAQLERLRLEERWKKMTQISELPSGADAGAGQLHLPLLDLHKTGRGGYNGNTIAEAYPNIWASAWGGGAGRYSHPPRQVNPAVKTEGELSSTQNMASFSHTFDHQCVKKKWSHNDVLLGLMRHKGSSSSGVVGESGCLGWGGSGAGRNVHEETSCTVHGFGASSSLHVASFGLQYEPPATVDIGAFQRMEGSSEPMEYDFFPHKLNDIGSSSPETMAHEPATICEGASSPPTSSPATFIDLSLKLSCY